MFGAMIMSMLRDAIIFSGMPKWGLILIWIFGSLLALYILTIIVDLLFVLAFKRIMKKHNRALCVLYTSKLENIRKVTELLKERNIVFSPEYNEIISQLDSNDFADQSDEKCTIAKKKLTYLHQELLFVFSQHQEFFEEPIFNLAKNNVEEIDRNLRMNSIAYNSDVLGYNYWIRFLPCRYIFLLLKVKEKETI